MHLDHLRHARIARRPLFWVATHRLHHQNSDKTGDPHSPQDGWWWSHVGWLVRDDSMRDTALAPYVPDLRRDPFHRWLEKWHVLPLLVLSAVLALWGAIREGAFLAASLVSWGYLPANRGGATWHLVGQFRRAFLGQPPFWDP
jgi:fatty-acid desaturase